MSYPSGGGPEGRRRDLTVFGVLLAAGVLLTQLGADNRATVVHGLRASVLAPALSVHGDMAERRALLGRMHELVSERDSLARRLIQLTGVEAENARLRRMNGLRERRPPEFTVVEIVPGLPMMGSSHVFLVRAGTAEGLRAPAGVFTSRGLLGVVRSVSYHTGAGDFWTHPDFRVSVRAVPGGTTGIVSAAERHCTSCPESKAGFLLLEGVPYQAEVAPGTRLVTSGVGGVYPAGIAVGTILQVAETESGWEKSYLVEPAVHPGESWVAFVATAATARDVASGRDADGGRDAAAPAPASPEISTPPGR